MNTSNSLDMCIQKKKLPKCEQTQSIVILPSHFPYLQQCTQPLLHIILHNLRSLIPSSLYISNIPLDHGLFVHRQASHLSNHPTFFLTLLPTHQNPHRKHTLIYFHIYHIKHPSRAFIRQLQWVLDKAQHFLMITSFQTPSESLCFMSLDSVISYTHFSIYDVEFLRS